MMASLDKCPACDSGKIVSFISCTDHFLSGEAFNLFRCTACGFVFTQDYPDAGEIQKYYESEEYVSHDDQAKGLTNRLYYIARGIMLRRKRKLVMKMTGLRKGRILDTGCGTGHFAGEMKKAGWDVVGMEPNLKAREYAEKTFSLKTIDPGEMDSLADSSFDCVTLWHVLEHIHDLKGYMTHLHRILKPDGICLIALPNTSSNDCLHFGKYWAAWDVPRHLWHFNPASFVPFASRAGFLTEEIRPMPLDVLYISVLSSRYKGSSLPFVTGMLKGSWFLGKSLINRQTSGSLIYVLGKSTA